MKTLLLLISVIPTLGYSQFKEEEAKDRINYLKSQPIFVTQLELNEKVIKKMTQEEIAISRQELEQRNKNIKVAFESFWDVSDTILFITETELKANKKQFKGAAFFNIYYTNYYSDDHGKLFSHSYIGLTIPKKKVRDVPSHIIYDSSLVTIISELRILKLLATIGDEWNTRDLGNKLILIDKNELRNDLGERFVNLVRSRYKGSIMEVDQKFILNVLMRRDPKYIYLRREWALNAEDGTMILLL